MKTYKADEYKTIYSGQIKVGYDFSKRSIYLELKIIKTKKHYFVETIDHRKIRVFKGLSLSGYAQRHQYSDYNYCGQIQDELTKDNIRTYIVPKQTIERIKTIWDNYHLNELNPNCIHQNSFNCNIDNYQELADIETKKCPVGYKYGSRWLVSIIPDSIIKEIISIFEKYQI